jgi:rubrerythrin
MEEYRRYVRTVPANGITSERTDDALLLAHEIIRWESDETQPKYTGYLRSSSIYDACVRELVLGFFEGIEKKERIPHGLWATFAIGHAVHFWLQNKPHFFGPRLLGWWECLACGHVLFGRRPSIRCPQCSALPRAFVYREHTIKMKTPYRASGHVDAFLQFSDGKVKICDIKTIAGDKFQSLSSPLVSNVYQVIDYMILTDEGNTFPVAVDTSEAILLYIPKGHQATLFPAKAFKVPRKPVVEKTIRDMREVFTRAIEERFYPEPLEECVLTDFMGNKARRCPLQSLCKEKYDDR